jgi:hypothetical protein
VTLPSGGPTEQSAFSKNMLKTFSSGFIPDSIMCWR